MLRIDKTILILLSTCINAKCMLRPVNACTGFSSSFVNKMEGRSSEALFACHCQLCCSTSQNPTLALFSFLQKQLFKVFFQLTIFLIKLKVENCRNFDNRGLIFTASLHVGCRVHRCKSISKKRETRQKPVSTSLSVKILKDI